MSLRKPSLGWPLAALIPLLSLVLMARAGAQEAPYKVPDFTGKTYDVVVQMATDPRTHKQVFAHINPPPSPGATVLHQNPGPPSIVKYGANVDLQLTWQAAPAKGAGSTFLNNLFGQIATQQQQTYVPTMKGVSQTEAARRLEVARLRGNFIDGPDGVVIDVNPQEGKSVPRNSEVTVTMGTHVPPLAGQTVAEATQTLTNANLVIGTTSTPNGAGGTVSFSNPPEGTGVPFNSRVSVTLSGNSSSQTTTTTTDNETGGVTDTGLGNVAIGGQGVQQPTQVRVPDVTQLQLKTATVALREAGFRYSRHHGDVNGVVVSQNPVGNSEADPRRPVDLYFQLAQVAVPDVRDDVESVATSRLEQDGFNPRISTQNSWLPFSTPTVVAQDPIPGTMVAPGYSVAVVMGVSGVPTTPTLIGIIVLVVGVVAGGIVIVVKIIHKLFPPPTPLSPVVPIPAVTTPSPPTQASRTHTSGPEAHCKFVPEAGTHQVSIHAKGPAIRFSLTLRTQGSTPKYGIPKQPSVKRVR